MGGEQKPAESAAPAAPAPEAGKPAEAPKEEEKK
jgi:hypothetical protein